MIFALIGFAVQIFLIYDLLNVNYKDFKPVWRFTHSYRAQLAVQLILGIGGAELVFWKGGTVLRILGALALLLFALLFVFALDASVFVHLLRGKNDKTAVRTEGHPEGPAPWDEKYWLTSDVAYESIYPNSFLDIYRTEQTPTEKKPVFIYAHGGGYIFGDKSNGDPNAMGIKGVIRIVRQLLDAGFTVISTEYVFAPEYRYPSPIRQLNDLLHFLQRNEDVLGIDMTRVVLGGGSAGGQLMAQTACLQTNPEYAREFGVSPTLAHGEIKAVYLGCALLDNERFGETSSFLTNYFFYQMGRAYFHNTGVLQENLEVMQSNVITHASAAFPPAFITDGNAGTFNKQAHDLDRRLTELGVEHESMIFDGSEDEKLIHGFDTLEYEKGYAAMAAMVEYVREKAFI